MKRFLMISICFVFIITLCGCDTAERNIFHSAWDSSNGYELLINDPEKNPKISTPRCWIRNGENDIGLCTVEFAKDEGFLKIIWTYDAGSKLDIATVYENTNSFTLNGYTFTWGANLK